MFPSNLKEFNCLICSLARVNAYMSFGLLVYLFAYFIISSITSFLACSTSVTLVGWFTYLLISSSTRQLVSSSECFLACLLTYYFSQFTSRIYK